MSKSKDRLIRLLYLLFMRMTKGEWLTPEEYIKKLEEENKKLKEELSKLKEKYGDIDY